MARLLAWPEGVRYITTEPLSGPRTISAGGSQSITGWQQSVSSPFGGWRWRFGFPPLKGAAYRRFRGLVAALHGGANAVRMPIYDPDQRTNSAALGAANITGVQWEGSSADLSWFVPSTSVPWTHSFPMVHLASPVAKDAVNISLPNTEWGHDLGVGDYVSLAPQYFGLHVVTQVYRPGQYKIWPPVRKTMTTDDWVTLYPTLAMRLEGEEAGALARGQWYADGLTLTMVEVEDADVRTYFADAS